MMLYGVTDRSGKVDQRTITTTKEGTRTLALELYPNEERWYHYGTKDFEPHIVDVSEEEVKQ